MSFESKIEIKYLIELVYRDKIWFISNLKTLEVNAWLLVNDPRDWTL